jgi:hypothetical protein
MPIRLLRPGLRNSERFNRCDYFTQSFYVRLLLLVDDFGRYEAHPVLLRNECFPYGDPKGDDITVTAIASSLTALCQQGLIELYEVETKKYLQLLRWQERPRSASKFPQPASTLPATCGHLLTSPPSPSPSPSPASTRARDASRVPAECQQSASTPTAEPHLPAAAEVIDFGQGPAGIPEAYCQHYWDERTNKKMWLNPRGALIDWRRDLGCWWKKDRAAWGQKRGSPNSLSALETLEAELASEQDPEKRAELRQRRKELTA